jgi:hypothetical protein
LSKSMTTYKKWVSELRRECLRRQKSAPVTSGKDSFCWPTPSAGDGGGRLKESVAGWVRRRIRQKATNPNLGDLHMPLTMAVRLWDTGMKVLPIGLRWTWASLPDLIIKHGGELSQTSSRLLNPLFVEWLMGLPPGWTDCDAVVTPSFRSWLHTHSTYLRILLKKVK